ncbi:MAG: F0F1 ATP synthase subunit A [Clostridiales bacterium]|nr:F0F1 ATP synthase subunit A [Clostridiales bacterium]
MFGDKTVLRLALTLFFLAVGSWLMVLHRRAARGDPEEKAARRRRNRLFLLGVSSLWLACGLAVGFFVTEREALSIQIMAPRVQLFGLEVSSSVLISWIAIALLALLALAVRLLVIPKFTDQPGGLQNLLELLVESVSSYTGKTAGELGDNLSAYMLSVAAFLITCGLLELFGLRPPTADLVMTLSLALCTFLLINYYGFKKKGVGGRLKSMADPTPVILPIRLLTDVAIPVSLGCRLFGNMLGGMIVVDLVYIALGAFGVGIPAVLGVYFNIFHPLIQTFIFVTLSLTFINEAVE